MNAGLMFTVMKYTTCFRTVIDFQTKQKLMKNNGYYNILYYIL